MTKESWDQLNIICQVVIAGAAACSAVIFYLQLQAIKNDVVKQLADIKAEIIKEARPKVIRGPGPPPKEGNFKPGDLYIQDDEIDPPKG